MLVYRWKFPWPRLLPLRDCRNGAQLMRGMNMAPNSSLYLVFAVITASKIGWQLCCPDALGLVLAGHPSKNIAADLGISQRTVDNHRATIMKKTGSKSLPTLIRTALAAA
jgi:Bacterial regulatory proteins, luxR family